MSSPLLITGLPRSGTTFVGKVLSQPENIFNIGEPFLHQVGTYHHYPYYRSETPEGIRYDQLLSSIFEYQKLWQYRMKKFEWSIAGLRRYVLGSRRTLEYFRGWWNTQVRGREGRLMVKEPHALMLTFPAVQDLDCQVLVLVRHPGGQVSSKLSLGWTDERDRPRSLLDQPKLIEDYLGWLPDVLERKERSTVEDLGLMWRAQYDVLLNYLEEVGDSEQFRIVRHEDVCLNPFEQFSELYDWANFTWTQEITAMISDLTNTDNPTERSESTDPHQHRLRRDSSTVVDVWKKRLSHKQIQELREITEPVSSKFYDDKSWNTE